MQNVWLDADRDGGRSEQEPHRRKADHGKTGLGFPGQRSRKCWQESGLGNIQQPRWQI